MAREATPANGEICCDYVLVRRGLLPSNFLHVEEDGTVHNRDEVHTVATVVACFCNVTTHCSAECRPFLLACILLGKKIFIVVGPRLHFDEHEDIVLWVVCEDIYFAMAEAEITPKDAVLLLTEKCFCDIFTTSADIY